MPLTLKNFNITWWQPWANTVAYYPLSSDLVDTVHSQTLTPEGTYTFETVWWATVDSVTISQALLWTNSYLPIWNNNRTISLWCRITSWWQNDSSYFAYGNTSANALVSIYGDSSKIQISQYGSSSNNFSPLSLNTWNHVCLVYQSSTFYVYVNWNTTPIGTWGKNISTSWNNIYINQIPRAPTAWNKTWNWSNIIIEDKARTDTEVADYYNQTKSLYGII